MSTFNELIDFTRSTTGTYLGSDGLLKTAAVDEPRLEYDAQGNALGLLIEEARTNLIAYSAVTTVNWSQTGSTNTNRNDNALGVFSGLDVVSNGQTWNRASISLTIVSGNTYAVTVFYKEGTAENVRITCRANGVESNLGGQAGSLTIFSESAGPLTLLSEEDYGGIKKVTLLWTPNSSSGVSFGIGPNSNVSGESVIAYGAQVETGTFPTSYIPTEGSSVTRAVDSAVATLSKFYYRQKNGSMVVEFTSKYDESAVLYKKVCEIGNTGTGINRILLFAKTDETRLSTHVYDNNVFQTGTNLTSSLPNGTGVYSKTAYAWETNNAHAAFDGNVVGSVDTDVSLTQTRDTLGIMRGPTNTAATLTGHIKSIQYYPLRVADAKLETLTS